MTDERAKPWATALFTFAIFSLNYSCHASDGYFPPISLQRVVETYTIESDGSYREEQERSTLIENEQGVHSFGERTIDYVPDLETVEIKEAYTILPDGSRIPVPEKNIKTTNDALNRSGAMYSDRKHKVIIYPNVVVGSQLFLRYIKIRHESLFTKRFAIMRVVSPHIKYGYYEINFVYDTQLNMQFDTREFTEHKLPDKDGMLRKRYSFKQDKFLPIELDGISTSDFAPQVLASNFENYEAVGRAYQEKANEKVKVTPAIQKLADELTKGVTDKRQQARILYNWVSNNIRYVGAYIGNGGYVPHDSQTILENKWGDCKDHVVLLEALLLAKGIESSAALINTANSYRLPTLAGVYAFNHVITYVPSLSLYLDSTNRFVPFGVLPSSDLDKQVVLTGLNSVGKTPPMNAHEHGIHTTITLKVMPDGTVQGNTKVTSSGRKEVSLRGTQFSNQTDSQEQVINDILSGANLTGHGEIHSTDPSDLDKPLEIKASFTLDPVSNFPGPAAMNIPTGVAFGVLKAKMLEKPRSQIHYPIKCYSSNYINHIQIEFPPKVRITHIPENVNYNDGVDRYTAKYKLKGKVLEINRSLYTQHPAMTCGPDENEREKKFFPVFQRDMRAQIIYE